MIDRYELLHKLYIMRSNFEYIEFEETMDDHILHRIYTREKQKIEIKYGFRESSTLFYFIAVLAILYT